jgi:hypothetical protein
VEEALVIGAAGTVTDDWNGEDTTIAEVERRLCNLRAASTEGTGGSNMRTSVMTHCAWVPPEWLDVARLTLGGMNDRHPSRTLILVPLPGEPDGLDADVSLRCFPSGNRDVCGEVVELRLRGNRTRAAASIVLPLLISDLPVFCRWRGQPPFGAAAWDDLVKVADRVIVDSTEWADLRYAELAGAFDTAAFSDIAWARLDRWRFELAGRWPEIRDQKIRVRGPAAEAALLRGWLAAQLGRVIEPAADAARLGVSLNGEELPDPRPDPRSQSDLLSGELDRFGRDRIYEKAVAAAV